MIFLPISICIYRRKINFQLEMYLQQLKQFEQKLVIW